MGFDVTILNNRVYFEDTISGNKRQLTNPTFQLNSATGRVLVFDEGVKWDREFGFEDFINNTIDGLSSNNIGEAYDLLTSVQNSLAQGGSVTVTSSALPTGASTENKQNIGNTSLSNIDTKIPALVGGKTPVVTSSTDSSVTVSGASAIGVAPSLAPVSVSGIDGSGLKRHFKTDTAGKLEIKAIESALPSGTNTIGKVQFDTTNNLITFDKTNYTQSTSNNRITNLTSGQIFTGGIESALNYPNVIISIRSDQPFTLTIKQYSDLAGTIVYPDITYTRLANQGFNDTVTIVGSYYSINVQNTGVSTTTNFFLETWLGVLPVAQNSTNLGNAPIAINEIGGTAITIGSKTKALSFPVTLPTDLQGQSTAATSIPVTLSNENVQDLFFTGQSAQTALINNIIPTVVSSTATDLTGYRSGSVQILCPTGTYTTGAIIFEGSNDNTNFVTIPVWNQLLLTGAPFTAAITLVSNTFIVYTFPITTRYVRVRISTAVSGASSSVQAISKFSQTTWVNPVTQIAQATGANLNATITTLPTLASVTTVSTLTTLANGQTAHSSASTGSPLRVAGRVVPTTLAAVDTTLAAGDASDAGVTSGQQLVIKPFGTSELDSALPILPSVTTTTPQSIFGASGTALVRNYIAQLSIQTDTLGAAGNMFILDNQGAIGTSVTIATPGVFTSAAHDLKVGDAIIFTSLGTITGVSVNTIYYITATTLAATTFTVATTPGGTAIQITGSTSAFTFYRVFYMFRLNTTALSSPYIVTPPTPWRAIANSNINVYFPTSLTSGTVYLNVNGYRGF